jgi:hypothetical protein
MRHVIFQLATFFVFASLALSNEYLPFLTAEKLLLNPNRYNRKIIVVEGWLHCGLETLSVQSVQESTQPRSEQIWLKDVRIVNETEKMWPNQKKFRATKAPVLTPEGQEKYQRLFSSNTSAHVILKGEFQTARKRRFGHLSAFRHCLIVYEVIAMEPPNH